MNHNLTGIHPKKINIEKGVFESSGEFFYINLEAMSFVRLKRFYEIIPSVAWGKKYTEILDFIHTMRLKMTTGPEGFKETYYYVATQLTNFDQYLIENPGDFADSYIDDVLRLCSLFILSKGEDATVIDDVHLESKIEKWKSDMDMMSFFHCALLAIPHYRELMKKLLEESAENGRKVILPVN